MLLRALAGTALVVVALILVACGGGGDSGERTGGALPGSGPVLSSEELCAMTMADFDNVGPAPMSPDIAAIACVDYRMQASEFVTQADALCADARAFNAALTASDPVAHHTRRAEIRELQLKNFEALRALAPMPDVESSLNAVVEVLSRAARLQRESVVAASASNAGALEELQARLAGVEDELSVLAESAGLRECV